MLRKIILFFFFLFWSCGFFSQSFAQIMIEQGKIVHTLRPGQTTTGEVVVHNTSDQNITIRAYWQDFVYVPPFDGRKNFLHPGTADRSCAGWVHFTPQEINLGPFGKQAVSYSLRFPDDAQGGYYGVLFFEDSARDRKTQTGVTLITRVGSLFFVEEEGAKRRGQVKDVSTFENQIRGTIENKNQIILIPEGIFYIIDREGMVVDRGETETLYLPPGESGPFFLNIAKNIPSGYYTLVLTFETGHGDSFVSEIDFQKIQDSQLNILQVRD